MPATPDTTMATAAGTYASARLVKYEWCSLGGEWKNEYGADQGGFHAAASGVADET
ncbi:hypothetical protein [Streptomyces lonegramiae]|uniref:Uncharacterized protein n=1 Tax=Streptomyces lonegramiae TaxID=3075524 RepID=A0ABU2XP52_9ACTN|nr:hypothetical protein [Streptomyces sp. DSM 41529]MDT0547702.1 hypothetical protein [Streptomyces sp. DSM 41529]